MNFFPCSSRVSRLEDSAISDKNAESLAGDSAWTDVRRRQKSLINDGRDLQVSPNKTTCMYQSPTPWTGRTDHLDDPMSQRWHQVIQYWDLTSPKPPIEDDLQHVALIGFCCDEGVRRNQGRIGAAQGPDALRKAMSGFPATPLINLEVWDAGNISCEGEELETAQREMGQAIASLMDENVFPIILGGGHETAWASYLGLQYSLGENLKVGIINIDAHFDLRSAKNPNSGTPFLQMAEWCDEHYAEFNYLVLGIQETGNTQRLFRTAKEYEVQFLTAEALMALPFSDILSRIDFFLDYCDLIYLSIDLDVFDAAFAPGVSAPSVLGLRPTTFLPILRHILASGKVDLVDICELNPELDIDGRTAKLGARWVWEVVRALGEP